MAGVPGPHGGRRRCVVARRDHTLCTRQQRATQTLPRIFRLSHRALARLRLHEVASSATLLLAVTRNEQRGLSCAACTLTCSFTATTPLLLNCHWQVCRDHKVTGSAAFLRAVWPAALEVMTAAQQWDEDGDGLIENQGFPDQVRVVARTRP
jgi:Glycosyl-hydrolase family 116, catalytic region